MTEDKKNVKMLEDVHGTLLSALVSNQEETNRILGEIFGELRNANGTLEDINRDTQEINHAVRNR